MSPTSRRPLVANRTTALAVGWVLFLAGAFLLYDAFDGRGEHVPWPLGAVMPW
jgi:uncharacterized membrane protein HdeD (DUF308 family)